MRLAQRTQDANLVKNGRALRPVEQNAHERAVGAVALDEIDDPEVPAADLADFRVRLAVSFGTVASVSVATALSCRMIFTAASRIDESPTRSLSCCGACAPCLRPAQGGPGKSESPPWSKVPHTTTK